MKKKPNRLKIQVDAQQMEIYILNWKHYRSNLCHNGQKSLNFIS